MIKVKSLSKEFIGSSGKKEVFKDINLDIDKYKIYGIIGPSGAGKSTILNIVAGLVKPDSGQVLINEIDITSLNSKDLRQYQKDIGVVFQDYNLLSNLTVLDNVALPLKLSKIDKGVRENEARKVLAYVGLENEVKSYPSELSGGMKQRVAIARAIIKKPKILLLDEVTSALDQETANIIIRLLKRINKELGITILIVSHDILTIRKLCTNVSVLKDGKIVDFLELEDINDDSDFNYKQELGVLYD
ncbi:MAG: ATP-binding cassette domain-containing protein [Bacilli bacterium]|nr:ATP-binding cassette domain-containing protein [Bacilli bacterium]